MRYHSPHYHRLPDKYRSLRFPLHVCNIFVMYGKIIFNNIEYVKLFPVFNASMAVFVYYPHLIRMYSTLNPHKIAELSTLVLYFLSEKKADSVSISAKCCTLNFRKSYFYLPVYPFSEQFFLLLFTGLIIIF